MGSWTGDEERVTTPEDMQAWVARTIWWQGRLDLLHIARESLHTEHTAVEAPEPVVEPARRTVRPRTAPAVGA